MLDDRDRATAEELVAHFAHITLDRPAPQPAREVRHRARWLVAAAAAAAAVAGVATAWPSGGDPAYAGWTPVPRAAQPGEEQQVIDACNSRTVAVTAGSTPFGPASIVEFRGSIALAIADGGGALVRCTARAEGDGWYAFSLGESARIDRAPVLEGAGGPEGMTWFVRGADERAARVDLTVPGYPVISATVVDGTYIAWWPQDRAADDDALPALRVDVYDSTGALVDTIEW